MMCDVTKVADESETRLAETPSMDAVEPHQVKDVVYAKLRDWIVEGTLTPGESLREAALTTRLGVSKTPVREALVRLEQDGLVESQPYRGARVRTYNSRDIAEIFDARGILEVECVRRLAHTPDVAAVVELEANLAATTIALEANDRGATERALDAFDDILFGAIDNELLSSVIERLALHLRSIGSLGGDASQHRRSLLDHRAIVDAIRSGNDVSAVTAMRHHLDRVREAATPGRDA